MRPSQCSALDSKGVPIAKGANPNVGGDLGRTAVHRACLFNCVDQLDLLIDAGGAPNATDGDRETPLHLAALKGHLMIVDRLLKLGVDAEQRSDYGTPLDRAAFGGHVTVLAALLSGGARGERHERFLEQYFDRENGHGCVQEGQ